jgi:hypothetical protein
LYIDLVCIIYNWCTFRLICIHSGCNLELPPAARRLLIAGITLTAILALFLSPRFKLPHLEERCEVASRQSSRRHESDRRRQSRTDRLRRTVEGYLIAEGKSISTESRHVQTAVQAFFSHRCGLAWQKKVLERPRHQGSCNGSLRFLLVLRPGPSPCRVGPHSGLKHRQLPTLLSPRVGSDSLFVFHSAHRNCNPKALFPCSRDTFAVQGSVVQSLSGLPGIAHRPNRNPWV